MTLELIKEPRKNSNGLLRNSTSRLW
jgi:hypothetical protein